MEALLVNELEVIETSSSQEELELGFVGFQVVVLLVAVVLVLHEDAWTSVHQLMGVVEEVAVHSSAMAS